MFDHLTGCSGRWARHLRMFPKSGWLCSQPLGMGLGHNRLMMVATAATRKVAMAVTAQRTGHPSRDQRKVWIQGRQPASRSLSYFCAAAIIANSHGWRWDSIVQCKLVNCSMTWHLRSGFISLNFITFECSWGLWIDHQCLYCIEAMTSMNKLCGEWRVSLALRQIWTYLTLKQHVLSFSIGTAKQHWSC